MKTSEYIIFNNDIFFKIFPEFFSIFIVFYKNVYTSD